MKRQDVERCLTDLAALPQAFVVASLQLPPGKETVDRCLTVRASATAWPSNRSRGCANSSHFGKGTYHLKVSSLRHDRVSQRSSPNALQRAHAKKRTKDGLALVYLLSQPRLLFLGSLINI